MTFTASVVAFESEVVDANFVISLSKALLKQLASVLPLHSFVATTVDTAIIMPAVCAT